MPWSSTSSSTVRPSVTGAHLDGGPVVGVLHGVVEQVVEGRDELAPVAEDGEAGAGLDDLDGDAAVLGGRPDALDGLGQHEVGGDRLVALGTLLALDAAEREQVVDGAADRSASSSSMRSASRSRTWASSSASTVSASRPRAPTGVLSSWLMLATKSRRTASSRRRSVMSSMTATRPTDHRLHRGRRRRCHRGRAARQ